MIPIDPLTLKTRDTNLVAARYRILRPHAKGGLGQVSVAQDTELPREVAFKEIQPERDHADARARFTQEAELTGGLEHPGIVPVYSFGRRDDGRPFYAMRFIRGQSLADAICELHGGRSRRGQGSGIGGRGTDSGQLQSPRDERQIPTATFDEPTDEANNEARTDGESSAESGQDPSRPVDYGSLGFRRLLSRFIAVCQAVEYAHSRGVLHRDIKPANIMLGDFGETLLVDWGLAKADRRAGGVSPLFQEPPASHQPAKQGANAPRSPKTSAPLDATQPGTIFGTPAYMSPEQASGHLAAHGPASDVYSLGATLYSLLTNRPAFHANSVNESLDKVRAGEFLAPRAVSSAVPKALEAICLKAMARNPAHRYASARALAEDVEHYLSDEPVAARPETAIARIARFGRKHRGVVRTVAAGLILFGLVALGAAVRESRLRARESLARREAESNFASAKQAVDNYVETVTNAALLKEDRFRPLLNDLLEDARAFYGDLIDRSEGRPERLAELASASHQVGVLSIDHGSAEEAQRAFERALAANRALSAEYPTVAEHRSALAGNLANLALLKTKLSDAEAALKDFDEAIGILREISANDPAAIESRADLASSLNNRTVLLRNLGDTRGAFAGLEEAIAIRRQLVDENPAETTYRNVLARSYNNLGLLQRETEDAEGALASFREAIAILQPLAEGDPSSTDHRTDLATSLTSMADLLIAIGDAPGALANHETALAIRKELAKENPNRTEYRVLLAMTHNSLGLDLSELGNDLAALAHHEQALAIRRELAAENPLVTEHQVYLANSLSHLASARSSLGDAANALVGYEQTHAIRKKLADENRDLTGLQADLARSFLNLGVAKRATGDLPGALADYDRGIEIATRLAKDHPAIPEYKDYLAVFLVNRGNLHNQMGDAGSSIASYREAIPIRKSLVEDNPLVIEYQSSLANGYTNLGIRLWETGQPAAARIEHASARKILTALADNHAEFPSYTRKLGGTLHNLALIEGDENRFAEAAELLRQAIAWQKQALAANPNDAESRQFMSNHLTEWLRVATAMGDADQTAQAQRELAEFQAAAPQLRTPPE